MKLKSLWGASLVMAALAASSCEEQQSAPLAEPTPATLATTEQQANSTNKVLILGSSVDGAENSREAQAVDALGYDVVVVSPEEWSSMSAQKFMEHRAIIIGDAACQTGPEAFQAAVENSKVWGAIVDGSVVIIGADPTSNTSAQVVESAVEFVLRRPNRTGMYVALGCAYKDAPPDTPVPLLAPFGEFKVQGVGCANQAHLFDTSSSASPYFSEYLWDEAFIGADLCSARSVFTTYPSNTFADVAIAWNTDGPELPGSKVYFDYWLGTPYTGAPFVLLTGNTAKGAGCGIDGPTSEEQCDLGDGGNGRPAAMGVPPEETCSFSCSLNWCGDGAVDADLGEECDKGSSNGRKSGTGEIGECSAFCKIPDLTPTSNPPEALCKNVTLVAEYTCGMDADINDGSSDPDGDLEGCTQSPAGPYDIGTRTVTLLCTDSEGNEDSCTGTVTVTDSVFPTITLVGAASQTLECTAGGTYTDEGATANDLCEGDLTGKIQKSGAVSMGAPGSYPLSYDVEDASGNSPDAVTRSVTVQDTKSPVLTLSGSPNQGLECGTPFSDQGATASDQCAGDLTAAIVKSGTVNHMAPATYPITYNVKDPSNHAATEVSRIVTVSDTQKPVVTVIGPPSVSLECSPGTYTDPGATAEDACAGVLPAVPSSVPNPGQPGSYTITYTATDPSNNVGVSSTPRTVTVSDTQPPTMVLNGQPTQGLECGSAFVDEGATANDLCRGALPVVTSGEVKSNTVGSYPLTYTANDGAHSASVNRTVDVADTLAPVVSVTGSTNISLECGDGTYTDPGASAEDACVGPLPAVPSVVPNQGQPGTYTVTYTATDPSNNVGTSSTPRTVTVSDTRPPTLTISGPPSQTIECKSPFSDPVATASDLCAGNLSASIEKTGSVNPNVVGDYALGYSVSDGQGHTATANREVKVRDTLAPVVSVTGSTNIQLECGDGTYTDQGATAEDGCVGPLPAVPSAVPNQGTPGTWAITYTATDPSNNVGTSSTARSVTVSDTRAPTLTLLGNASENVECKSPYTDPGATASDLCAGDLSGSIVKTGGVNTDVPRPNPYEITYNVNDGQGHTASATRAVTVRDTQDPSITLVGPPTQEYACGSTYVDPGATASDLCYGDLTAQIVAEQSGNPNQPGTFTVTYKVTDPAGNEFVLPNARTVEVDDNEAPTLELLGSATPGLECGTPFADPGARANDVCFGDVTSRITVTGDVDHQTPGSYPLTYNVTDPANQSAPSRTRTVTVSDTLKPVVTVTGDPTAQVECGSGPYVDPGATATDACAGTLPAVPSTVVDPNAPNSYVISYSATDPSNNTGVSTTTRTVTVADTQPPTLELLGNATVPLECATPYTDPGATANDLCAGNISGLITREGTVNNMQPADYALTYKVTDPAGRSAPPVNRTVQVRDTTDPFIQVLGPLNDTFACGGGEYPDPGATASDTCAGDLTAQIQKRRIGGTGQTGTFQIEYSVTDPSGNDFVSPVLRTVSVNDTEKPTLVLVGNATETLECGTPHVDPGATANDVCFGDISGSVTREGTVNHQVPAAYPLTYRVTDPAGQVATPVSRTVNVTDTLPPSIEVLGPQTQQVACGSGPYPDPGATASDVCAGNLTGSIVVTGGVNTGAAGTYTLSYKVADPSGNETTAATGRTVTVVDDAPPTISLIGDGTQSLECGTPYTDPGATANDLCAGDLSAAIVRNGTVDHQTPGSYPVTYTVTDPSNRTATANRTVNVSDTLPPQLVLNGTASQTIECGSSYVDPGAAATDVCAGDLSAAVVASGTVNPNVEGTYPVTYTVEDPTGHDALAVNRTVTVDDTTAPLITVEGPLNPQHECGSGPYPDPGATANDLCYGNLTSSIVATPTGNPNEPGSYTITYSVQDPAGNSTTSPVKRTVKVNDSEAPVLALLGPSADTLECGTPYVDPGATATDTCIGDVSVSVQRSGTVNHMQPATYTLVYNVSDTAGNPALSVSRSVEVDDSLAPNIQVQGPLNTTYECGTTYSDPGATASDACAGDLTAAVVATQTPNPDAPGNFIITYSVTDPSGNQAISPVTRTVSVDDDAPPQISLNGAATQFLECSRNPYIDPGATATDVCVGGPVPVTVTGSVNMRQEGLYTLQYSAKDPAGNTSATLTRQVNVNDSVGPVIDLLGEDTMYLECNRDQYVEEGATADDLCAGDSPVTVSGNVDESVPGYYAIRYTATDLSGNETFAIRNVNVRDLLPPTIALNGPNPMRLECGIDTFVDPGGTATDLCKGDVSSTLAIEFNNVVEEVEGNYIVRYQARDNVTEVVRAERQVVVDDLTAPTITIAPGPNPTVECGGTPNLLAGVTATDACYGNVNDRIVVTPATLPTDTGLHVVYYTASDPVGNQTAAPGVARTFEVVDNTPPVLCTKADNNPNTPCIPFEDQDMVFECTGHGNNLWEPPIVAAQDLCDGTIPVHQYNTGDDDMDGIPGCDCNYYPCGGEGPPPPGETCDTDDYGPGPSTENEGLYYVQYLAWDDSYRIQDALLSVYVKDTIKPTIELNGDPVVQTQCFLPLGDETDPDPYIDPGATAWDICYGDLNQEVFCYNDVNKQIPGVYVNECVVRDGAYNWADSVSRTVQVIDNIAPVVTVKPTLSLTGAVNEMRQIDLTECVERVVDRCDGFLDPNSRGVIEPGTITCSGPGCDASDMVRVTNSRFQLRIQAGNQYTVPFTVFDNLGNVATSQCTFQVPATPVSSPVMGSGTLAGR